MCVESASFLKMRQLLWRKLILCCCAYAAFFMEKIKAIAGAASVEVTKEYVPFPPKLPASGMLKITLITLGCKDPHTFGSLAGACPPAKKGWIHQLISHRTDAIVGGMDPDVSWCTGWRRHSWCCWGSAKTSSSRTSETLCSGFSA